MVVVIASLIGCGLSGERDDFGCSYYLELLNSILRRTQSGEADDTIMVDLYDLVWEDIARFTGGEHMNIVNNNSPQPMKLICL
mgnify:CR=1 FL=1